MASIAEHAATDVRARGLSPLWACSAVAFLVVSLAVGVLAGPIHLGVGAVLTETTDRLRAEQRARVQHAVTALFAEADALDDAIPSALETIALLLRGAIEAEVKVGLKLNVREADLPQLLQSLPALRNPTVSALSLSGWVAVETIIDEPVVREIGPQLFHQTHGRFAVTGLADDLVPFLGEHLRQVEPDQRLILGDDHAPLPFRSIHGSKSPCGAFTGRRIESR